MVLQNFLPLRREVMEHWVYKDNDYFKVWVEMLFKARFNKEPKKDIYEGSLYTLNYGEFLFSRPKWSQRLNIPDHKLRKLISLLEKDEMISKSGKVGKSGATIYLIKNYDKYNNSADETPALPVANSSVEGDSSQPNANETPTKSQRNATKEESNKANKFILSELDFAEIRSHFKGTKNLSVAKKKLPSIVKKYGKEKIIDAIKKYTKEVDTKRNNGFKDLQFVNESTFWNGRYIDYLDSPQVKTETKPLVFVEREVL